MKASRLKSLLRWIPAFAAMTLPWKAVLYLAIVALNCLACCAATVVHEPWTVPLPTDEYSKDRIKRIVDILEFQIKKTQAYGDSTLELVDYGVVTMTNGIGGKRFNRAYDSTGGYFVVLQGLMDYAYVETTYQVFETGRTGILLWQGGGIYQAIIDMTRPHPAIGTLRFFATANSWYAPDSIFQFQATTYGGAQDSFVILSRMPNSFDWSVMGMQIDTVWHSYVYDNIDSDSIYVKAVDRNGKRAYNDNAQVVYLVWKRDR